MFIRNLYPMQNYYCPDNLAIPYFKYLFAFFGPLTTQKRLEAYSFAVKNPCPDHFLRTQCGKCGQGRNGSQRRPWHIVP